MDADMDADRQLAKLVALDEEDLAIVSAHVQDAVFRPAQAKWFGPEHRFVVPLNRFVWEKAARTAGREAERRGAVLNFDRVTAVKATGLPLADPDAVAVLLAITFHPAAEGAPEGTIQLHLGGGARIRLSVECVEARLGDLGAAWRARRTPDHGA